MTPLEKALTKGYSPSHCDEYSDQILEKYDLLVIRGMCKDYIFRNDKYGREVLKSNNRKLGKKKPD
jgi:hypothetical protein